jgi:hypothetical protein
VEQVLEPKVKRFTRREPLGFAFFWLILYLIVEYARPGDWILGLESAHLARIAVSLILLALLFSFHQISWRMPKTLVFLILMMAQLWLSVLFSPVWKQGAFNVMQGFSKVLLLVIVIYGVVRSMNRLRWIFIVQSVCVTAVCIESLHTRHSTGRLQGVLSGMYENPNDFALVIDFTLPFCLALALTTKSYWQKLVWIAVMLAMIYTMFQTASRGGAIALAIAALVCLWQFGIRGRRFYLLLLVPIAVIVISLYGGNTLRDRFEQTNLDSSSSRRATASSDSALERKELLIRSLKVTAEHPLFGVGPGNFEIISGLWRVTHNSYTEVSSEGGIPAFILYVLVFWSAIVNLKQVRRYSKSGKVNQVFSMALGASLAAYLAGSFFASVAFFAFPYCLVAYTSALSLIVQRNKVAPAPAPEPTPAAVEPELTAWQ